MSTNDEETPAQTAIVEQPSDDVDLLARAQTGDSNAVDKLVTRYRGRVYRLCRRFGLYHEEAIDLEQDVLLKFIKAMSALPPDSKLDAWIHKITITTCIDQWRKSKRRNCDVSLAATDEHGMPLLDHMLDETSDFANQSNEKLVLWWAFECLDEQSKRVLIGRVLEDKTRSELADELSIDSSLVRRLESRAKLILREQ